MQNFIDVVSWLKTNTTNSFNKSATDREITNFTKKFPMLDDSVIQVYRLHNGQPDDLSEFVDGLRFLPINAIISFYEECLDVYKSDKILQKPCDPKYDYIDCQIKPSYWNTKWIPILGTPEMKAICLDYDPAVEGRLGQLIEIALEDCDRYYIKESLFEYFKCIKTQLMNGNYQQDENMIDVGCCYDSKVLNSINP